MGVTINKYETYNSTLQIDFGEKVVFFKVGAEWCIPCIELDKILACVEDSVVYHISIDNVDFESFFTDKGIYTVPDTTIKYKNKTHRFRGIKSLEQIKEAIEKLKSNE